MNVLVDTSVWVGHFKQRNDHLIRLLEEGVIVCHPFVVAEVACGSPPSRAEIIGLLTELESVPVATQTEILSLLESRRLYGRGCGFVDVSLLASTLISGVARLWTMDKKLERAASDLNLAYRPVLFS